MNDYLFISCVGGRNRNRVGKERSFFSFSLLFLFVISFPFFDFFLIFHLWPDSWRIFIAATPRWSLNVNSSSAAVPDLWVQLLCRLRFSHWTQINPRKESERQKDASTDTPTHRQTITRENKNKNLFFLHHVRHHLTPLSIIPMIDFNG